MRHHFVGLGRSVHLPDGSELDPDGMPSWWDEYEVHRCRNCGREGLGAVHRGYDETGRADVYSCLPVPGEEPNEDLGAHCDPSDVDVWSVMNS